MSSTSLPTAARAATCLGALALLLCAAASASANPDPAPSLNLVEDGFDFIANAVAAQDGSGRIFVLEQFTGRIRLIEHGQTLERDFLDLGDKLIEGPASAEGLLGLALAPDGADEVYLTYVSRSGELVLSRFQTEDGGRYAERSSEEVLLTLPRDDRLHTCGHLEFGPRDGLLYLCFGDTQEDPRLNAVSQDLSRPHGKMLRIDVDSPPPDLQAPLVAVASAADGPFAAHAAVNPDLRLASENWLHGLRNPWRFGFDPETGAMFLPDVGRFHWEELNYVAAGTASGNYGWPLTEGNECLVDCTAHEDLVWPVFSYAHQDLRCSIIGGTTVSPHATPAWRGIYLFADFCSGEIFGLRGAGSATPEMRVLARTDLQPVAITRGPNQEVLIIDGPNGAVWRLDLPASPDGDWRPTREVMMEFAFDAVRSGFSYTRELLEMERIDRRSMMNSLRWRLTEPLVKVLNLVRNDRS